MKPRWVWGIAAAIIVAGVVAFFLAYRPPGLRAVEAYVDQARWMLVAALAAAVSITAAIAAHLTRRRAS